jgi:tetratricopeptide (TPR) repeat protein
MARLLELGHEREVEFQAGRGEWFCALGWARLLGHRGRREQALEVLAPYIAMNWWPAAQARAELLEGWGRVEEAIALSRPYAEAGDRPALAFFACLLARHDRSGEAFMLLRAGIQDGLLAECLVDVAEAAGMDEEAAALLEARVEAAVPVCNDADCDNLRMEPFNAVDLLATIRERQGRIEEAIALLHTRKATFVNGRDQLADLLARHDRITELRAYAASEFHGHAAQRLAEVLEERGDVEAAIAAYRKFGATPDGMWHVAVPLSELLVRHGRADEAIEVVRTLAESPGGAEDWIVRTLCALYADHGRPRDGLAHLDALKAQRGGREEWDFFRMRLPLMADCGLLD